MTNKEKTKGFVFTEWTNAYMVAERTSYKCMGVDLKTGRVSEWVQDAEGNRIEDDK